MTIREIPSEVFRAHELYGDYWLNSEPVPVTAMKGRVVLIHFWDYSNVASIRMLPYVSEWQRRYERFGLVVVAVHAPRYDFAKDPARVARAVEKHGIVYPVVLDNQHLITASYDVQTSPSVVLVDKRGFVRCRSVGDRDYEEIERSSRSLLLESGTEGDLPVPMGPIREEDRKGAVCYRATPDLPAGYSGGNIGNIEGSPPESVVAYSDPGLYLEGKLYAEGPWFNGRSFIRLAGRGKGPGRIFVRYNAAEVHAVLAPDGNHSVEVELLQDGESMTGDRRGEDVILRPDGRSVVSVVEPRSYSLVQNPEFGDHLVCLTADESFSFYSFSFVSSAIPESISGNQ